MRFPLLLVCCVFLSVGGCNPHLRPDPGQGKKTSSLSHLRLVAQEEAGTLSVFREREKEPILIQNAQAEVRPFVHPIRAPDGKGILTEYRPAHHKHQTGLYWGLKMVNGRDFFMNGFGDYWRRVATEVIEAQGSRVKWRTVYYLLDEKGQPVMTETQTWTLQEENSRYLLDLEWRGEALTDLSIGQFYVGGLFLRMPWRKGMAGEVVNAAGQKNQEAEQQRAPWTDIGLQVEGREDLAHIAILDHPENKAFPVAWRVDGELGVGPSRQILGPYEIPRGETEVVRYRLLVYTGALKQADLNQAWQQFAENQF